MPSVAVVTTFAKDHIDLYGKRFVDSFKQNCNYPLYIFAEDFDSNDIGTEVLDYYTYIPQHLEFKNYILKASQGLETKPRNRLNKALRWSYKSYVIIYALENIDADYIVWLDADVETINNISDTLISNLCGNSLMMCYPQLLKGGLHIESGLVIFNKKHPLIKLVNNHYRKGYYHKEVLKLDKAWDGFWLGKLIDDNEQIKNSTILFPRPFVNVKGYFHHHVGKEKFTNTNLDKFLGRKSLT